MNLKNIYRPGDGVPLAGSYDIVDAYGKTIINPNQQPRQIHIKGFPTFPNMSSPLEYGYRLVQAWRQT